MLGRGRCPSDPDPLQRGPCLRSCPSAYVALSDLGPCLWGCPPPEGSGWPGVWRSLARCVPPVTGAAWPSTGRGSSCLCTRAGWLTSCWPTGPRAVLHPACPSRVCSSRLLWGSRLRLAQFGPVSRACLACVYHPLPVLRPRLCLEASGSPSSLRCSAPGFHVPLSICF